MGKDLVCPTSRLETSPSKTSLARASLQVGYKWLLAEADSHYSLYPAFWFHMLSCYFLLGRTSSTIAASFSVETTERFAVGHDIPNIHFDQRLHFHIFASARSVQTWGPTCHFVCLIITCLCDLPRFGEMWMTIFTSFCSGQLGWFYRYAIPSIFHWLSFKAFHTCSSQRIQPLTQFRGSDYAGGWPGWGVWWIEWRWRWRRRRGVLPFAFAWGFWKVCRENSQTEILWQLALLALVELAARGTLFCYLAVAILDHGNAWFNVTQFLVTRCYQMLPVHSAFYPLQDQKAAAKLDDLDEEDELLWTRWIPMD